ncbi:MAG TPA: cupin domain-containing protein, partial [Alphaproteobacteria bacterium]|nr:cupin domain-containing protein [Alphaproteobacteria bacterium]
ILSFPLAATVATMTAEDLIARLALEPHPEGGHFVETYRQRPAAGRASLGSAIGCRLAWRRQGA